MSAQAKFNQAGTAARGFYQSPTFIARASYQFDLDAALWYGAITYPNSPGEAAMLTRLFGVLYNAGIMFKDSTGAWHDWNATYAGRNPAVPVAAALSHGGRLLIQLPPTNDATNWTAKPQTGLLVSGTRQEALARWKFYSNNKTDRGDFTFWDWLNGAPPVAQNRVISTHGLKMADNPAIMMGNHKLYLRETKGSSAGTSHSKRHQHYALNPALGGLGQNSPLSGQRVRGDGLDGHLYFLFFPPNEFRCGGLLVGCENAQFGLGSNRHTGAGHGAGGAANATSATGGLKWGEMTAKAGMTAPVPVGDRSDMVVDLTGNLAAVQAAAANFTADQLDQCPLAAVPPGLITTIPTDAEWKAATVVGGRLDSRSNHLKRIDTHLKMINADHPTIPHLNRLIQVCDEWLTKYRAGGFSVQEQAIDGEVRILRTHARQLRAAI